MLRNDYAIIAPRKGLEFKIRFDDTYFKAKLNFKIATVSLRKYEIHDLF